MLLFLFLSQSHDVRQENTISLQSLTVKLLTLVIVYQGSYIASSVASQIAVSAKRTLIDL